MRYRALFTPYIGLVFDEEGNAVGADVDWSDTWRNVYTEDGEEVTEDGEHELALTACSIMDAFLVGKGAAGPAELLRYIASLVDAETAKEES